MGGIDKLVHYATHVQFSMFEKILSVSSGLVWSCRLVLDRGRSACMTCSRYVVCDLQNGVMHFSLAEPSWRRVAFQVRRVVGGGLLWGSIGSEHSIVLWVIR